MLNGLFGYSLLLAKASYWADPATYLAIFKVVMGLGAVIFVHELGHFLVAKACGVKCEKFYVGFDAFDIKLGDRVIIPSRLLHFQWGETEYGIGILPFGGYVKMLGQDDNPGNIEEEVKRSMTDSDEPASSALTPEGLVDRTKIHPRSYLAKSVPQRMAIISAGVIFNLIFAILFAAIAFRGGVDYDPPLVGNVVGGGPAWEQNLAGAALEKVGDKETNGYFTYMDLAQEVGLNGAEPLNMRVRRPGQDESVSLEITPEAGMRREAKDIALLGVSRRLSPVVSGDPLEHSPAALASEQLQEGDRIVEVAGEVIETDLDLFRTLIPRTDQEVEFVIEREVKGAAEIDTKLERLSTKIGPNPMREFGFSTEWQPISNLQSSSPATESGLQVGDEIVEVDGQPRGSLLTLNKRMIAAAVAERSVSLVVKRGDEQKDISLQPIVPGRNSQYNPKGKVAIDALGIALPTTNRIESVWADSIAEKAGLQPADEIVGVKYLLSDEQKKQPEFRILARDPEVDLVKGGISWAEIFQLQQQLAPGSRVELRIKRGSELKELEVASIASEEFFLDVRGLPLTPLEAHYESDSWSDAFANGNKQVWSDATRVLKTFSKLILGKISATNLGGPGTIAVVATSEAAKGTPQLLLFLTFLSANLAVVNLLPIPVLDGGHLLFLAYEGIFRRPVNEKTQVLLMYTGLAMILCLMVFVVCLDTSRIYSMF